MNAVQKLLLSLEAAWVSQTVKLAPEPPGTRHGVVTPPTTGHSSAAVNERGIFAHVPSVPLNFVAVGDSLVAGCGVENQSDSLTPMVAHEVARREGRPVHWSTHAKLGATMRRVRHRFIQEIPSEVDLLMICAGSNDVLARRPLSQWQDDLSATLDIAQERATVVLVSSSGQPHNSPALPRRLRAELGRRIDEQTKLTEALCSARGVSFADVSNVPLPEGFWAADRFHPSKVGYETATDVLTSALYAPKCA